MHHAACTFEGVIYSRHQCHLPKMIVALCFAVSWGITESAWKYLVTHQPPSTHKQVARLALVVNSGRCRRSCRVELSEVLDFDLLRAQEAQFSGPTQQPRRYSTSFSKRTGILASPVLELFEHSWKFSPHLSDSLLRYELPKTVKPKENPCPVCPRVYALCFLSTSRRQSKCLAAKKHCKYE